MKSSAKSGAALIAGSVASLVTMSLHPSGRDVFAQGAGVARQVDLLIAVHALAIAALPVMFFGAVGLARRLSGEHGLATAALIAFGFAAVAAMGDATADGLITPGLIAQLANGPEAARDTVRAIIAYNGLVVRALANVYIAGSSLAIGLWSAAMLSGRTFSRGLGIFGCVVGSLVLAGLLAGYLRPTMHGMGLVVLVESAWLISVGVKMLRADQQS